MIVKVTNEITDAVRQFKESQHFSTEEVSAVLKVSEKYVELILSRELLYVRDNVWDNMEPHLRGYIRPAQKEKREPSMAGVWYKMFKWFLTEASQSDRSSLLALAEKHGFKH